MNVAVLGLWHLGSVTAACLADAGHHVIGYDRNAAVVAGFARGDAPVHEPGLSDWLRRGTERGLLAATTDPSAALAAADVIWIAWDTPILEDDSADVESVVRDSEQALGFARPGQLILISSQLPVGTTARLERACRPGLSFGYIPENLRLGTAIESFTKPARVVAGLRDAANRDVVQTLLAPFTDRIEWMSVESAEMTKHALNAYLATSVAFANEIARLCEATGADAADVARGLKTDLRIGPRAYVSPGGAFAGGTLARDVAFLSALGAAHDEPLDLIPAVAASNTRHQQWAARRLAMLIGDVRGRTIAVWGLTYKPGTDTLRGSAAVTLIEWLAAGGARVRAYDPVVKTLPATIEHACTRCASALEAAADADALVVATAWPEFRDVHAGAVAQTMRHACVLDENRFLASTLGNDDRIQYVAVGAATKSPAAGARDVR